MAEPMSDERLTTIRSALAAIDEMQALHDRPLFQSYMAEDVRALLAEVERLRAQRDQFRAAAEALNARQGALAIQNAAMREIVRAVAAYDNFVDGDGYFTQLQARARAIVAQWEPAD